MWGDLVWIRACLWCSGVQPYLLVSGASPVASVLAGVTINLALVAGLVRETVIALSLRVELAQRDAHSCDTVPETERETEEDEEEERDDGMIQESERRTIMEKDGGEERQDTRGQKMERKKETKQEMKITILQLGPFQLQVCWMQSVLLDVICYITLYYCFLQGLVCD